MQIPLKSLVLAGLIIIAFAASSHAAPLDHNTASPTWAVCDTALR